MEKIKSYQNNTGEHMKYKSFAINRTIIIGELVSFFCEKYPPGYQFKGECHNFWEFAVILGGEADICADNCFFRLKKGQAIWHKPNEFHSIRTYGETPLVLGIFSFHGWVNANVSAKIYNVNDDLCNLFVNLRKEADNIFVFYPSQERNQYLFQRLLPKKKYEMQAFVSKMEYLLASSLLSDSEISVKKYSHSEENYLRIIAAIEKNLDKRLSIPEIASECNMSVSNAKRVFAKFAGCGISAYYNSMVVSEAKRLLSEGVSVGETAQKLGFDSQNYFSSFFKRITGVPPSQYEKEHPVTNI